MLAVARSLASAGRNSFFQSRNLSSQKGLKLRLLDYSDREVVLEHVKQNFYKKEPTIQGTLWLNDCGDQSQFDDYMAKTLKKPQSFAFFTETGKIAALKLNEVYHKDEFTGDPLEGYTDGQARAIIHLIARENEKADLYTRFGVDEVFNYKIVSVDDDFQGQGLAKKLYEESEALARKLGIKVMTADLTSYYSQNLTKLFGWEIITQVDFKDYVDNEGRQVIRADPPHYCYQLKVKILK